jgi:hypothetical protein
MTRDSGDDPVGELTLDQKSIDSGVAWHGWESGSFQFSVPTSDLCSPTSVLRPLYPFDSFAPTHFALRAALRRSSARPPSRLVVSIGG